MSFGNKIGFLLLIAGVVVLAVFFSTDMSGAPQFSLLCYGSAGIALGILMLRWRRQKVDSGRFRIVREARQRSADRKQKAANPKGEKPGGNNP